MDESIKLLTAETRAYIEYHKLSAYIEDVVSLILEERPEKPLKFLHDYFESVRLGVNVVLREYQYVCATQRNRASFSLQIRDVLSENPIMLMEGPDEQLSVKNLHQTIQLVCPDFPFKIIREISAIAIMNFRLRNSQREEIADSDTSGRNLPTVVQGGLIETRQENDSEGIQSVPLSENFFNVFTIYLFFSEYFTITQKIFAQLLADNNMPNIPDTHHAHMQPLQLASSLVASFFKSLGNAIDEFEKKQGESIEIPPLRSVRTAAHDSFHYYAAAYLSSSGLDRVFVKMRIASRGSENANEKASTSITSNEPRKDQNDGGMEIDKDNLRIAHDRFVLALAKDSVVLNLIQETATCTGRDTFEAQNDNKRYWT